MDTFHESWRNRNMLESIFEGMLVRRIFTSGTFHSERSG
jgi:hypothetical protein